MSLRGQIKNCRGGGTLLAQVGEGCSSVLGRATGIGGGGHLPPAPPRLNPVNA